MKKLFEVVEYSSFFAVRHIPSQTEHSMGDGVDTLFDQEGKAISPGTPGFVEKWADSLNASSGETLEAYFPEMSGNEVKDCYENGVCPDSQEGIPNDVENGQACVNCEHVFYYSSETDD